MAFTRETYDSFGGFSVENTTVINDTKDFFNINSLEVKNQSYPDSKTSHYILRGNTTAVLSLDTVGGQIPVDSNTVNFVTAHVVGVNNLGTGHLSEKIESVITVNSSGDVEELSNLLTVIKDSVPAAETWTVTLFDTGAANRFSYSAVKSGGTAGQTIKWVAYVQVVSIAWA